MILALPSEEDRKRYLHLISLILPKSHRDTMEVLFVFLKWVASFAHLDAETGSKMDLGNLATVICPSILYARGRDAMKDETFSGFRVMTSLMENQDEFFAVPPEFLSILRDQEYFANSLELPGKEFMKKCDTYMRMKGNNGRPSPGTPHNGSSNGGTPRYPPLMSPIAERPPVTPFGSSSNSERNMRVPPQNNDPHIPSSSPVSQGMMQNASLIQNAQRNPQMEEWTPPSQPPRPSTNSPSSRPSSVVVSAQVQTQHNQPGVNGYPSPAVRQRT